MPNKYRVPHKVCKNFKNSQKLKEFVQLNTVYENLILLKRFLGRREKNSSKFCRQRELYWSKSHNPMENYIYFPGKYLQA